MSNNIKTRVRRLEERPVKAGIVNRVIDGFRYIGGKLGVLKVPIAVPPGEWGK